MGEYVKYRKNEIKIGCCESLSYVSYPTYVHALKSGVLTKCVGSDAPEAYASPDSGYRFRFPFPDENGLRFGVIRGDYDRGLPILIDRGDFFEKGSFPAVTKYLYGATVDTVNRNNVTEKIKIELTEQKLIVNQSDQKERLVLVYRCPFCKESWRIEDLFEVGFILNQIQKHYIDTANQDRQKIFWTKVSISILQGYHQTANQSN